MSFFPFYATQINNPLLNSRISANHDKVDGLSVNGETLIKGFVSLLYNLFYRALINIHLEKNACLESRSANSSPGVQRYSAHNRPKQRLTSPTTRPRGRHIFMIM